MVGPAGRFGFDLEPGTRGNGLKLDGLAAPAP